MSFLLDTNIVSELRRRSPSRSVIKWLEAQSADDLYVSVLTLGEIRTGIEQLRCRDETRADALDRWLGQLQAAYADRIVGIDAAIADRWARMNVPNRVPVIDGLLAATALVHGWTFVTRNVADVEATGVPAINPFESVTLPVSGDPTARPLVDINDKEAVAEILGDDEWPRPDR